MTFVGAEYLIANFLIAKKKKGISSVSIEELSKWGIFVQNLSFRKKKNFVFLTSSSELNAAIYDFSDYFSYVEENGEEVISIKDSKEIKDLEERFIGYLPTFVSSFLKQAVKEFVA